MLFENVNFGLKTKTLGRRFIYRAAGGGGKFSLKSNFPLGDGKT